MKFYSIRIKRILDFILATILFITLLPLYIIVYLLVRIDMGNPVLFRQKRIGYKEKPFFILKFRTMTAQSNALQPLIPDENRITKLGAFLRKTSLDELPQIINILKGEMSFIGPRPLMFYELQYLTDEEMKRHNVLPGISGLAQVSGRNKLSNDEKFQKDLEYVEKFSFLLDLKIFFKTIPSVLFARNITVINKTHLNLTRKSRNTEIKNQ